MAFRLRYNAKLCKNKPIISKQCIDETVLTDEFDKEFKTFCEKQKLLKSKRLSKRKTKKNDNVVNL